MLRPAKIPGTQGFMDVYVYFEDPPGTHLDTREFTPGQNLRIEVEVRDAVGLPQAFCPVILEIYDSFPSFYEEASTDLFGNHGFDIILPNVVTTAHVYVTATVQVGSNVTVDIPIGIGKAAPPIPKPPSLTTTLMWTAIGLGVLVTGYGVIKLIQNRNPQRILIEKP